MLLKLDAVFIILASSDFQTQRMETMRYDEMHKSMNDKYVSFESDSYKQIFFHFSTV